MNVLRPFRAYELRTTDVDSALEFYAGVLGVPCQSTSSSALLGPSDRPLARVSRLPERAAALGAPAHWLGHVEVPDVEDAAARLVALGGVRLGPPRLVDGEAVLFKDTEGAVLAFSAPQGVPEIDFVAWHELHTQDSARAWRLYASLFGWTKGPSWDLGLEAGPYDTFAWGDGAPAVGGLVANAKDPDVHPHWQFFFRVSQLDAALVRARSAGARLVYAPTFFPDGARVAWLEDPQGAAFSLHQRAMP